MLLPSLGKARKASQSSVCVNNLKQQNVALFLVQDNDGYLPLAPLWANTSQWKSQLYDYMGSRGSSTDHNRAALGEGVFSCPNSDSTATLAGLKGGYGYNPYLNYTQGLWGTERVTIESIETPAETVAIADTAKDSYFGLDWTHAWLIPPSWGDEWVGTRHNNGLNLMWVDGHVSQEKQITVLAGKAGVINHYWMRTK